MQINCILANQKQADDILLPFDKSKVRIPPKQNGFNLVGLAPPPPPELNESQNGRLIVINTAKELFISYYCPVFFAKRDLVIFMAFFLHIL